MSMLWSQFLTCNIMYYCLFASLGDTEAHLPYYHPGLRKQDNKFFFDITLVFFLIVLVYNVS